MIRVYQSLDDIDLAEAGKPVALTFGAFDGLHVAHRQLIASVRQWAEANGGLSAVLSFSNHPLSVLAPPYCPKMLMAPRRKIEILEQMGVDVVILPEFTSRVSRISARGFLRDLLVGQIGMRHIVCGYDSRFGHGGRGNGAMLRGQAKALGYSVEIIEPFHMDGTVVGSKMVRQLLLLGEVERAARLLERPHELSGVVQAGERRGGLLGFPTANLDFPDDRLIPATGVYAVWAEVGKRRYGGMMNIGRRPTFGKMALTSEVNLFRFDKSIYGQTLTVYFLKRLRAERKFSGPRTLRRQLQRDKLAARAALRNHGA